MNRGLVNLEELRKNSKNADFHGKSAYCFIDGNKIIKIYATKFDDDYIPVETKEVVDLSMYKADTIIFPNEYIYENGEKVGEILRYIRDKSVDKSFNKNARCNKIITGYEKVINDLELYKNIDMIDLCYVNILYSNRSGFHIIDTTEWKITDKSFKQNLLRFNSSLIRVFVDYLEIPIVYSKYYNKIDEVFFDNIKKFGIAGMKLNNNLLKLMNNQYDFLGLLYAYMDATKIFEDKEVETLKEMKEFTKVLKKG